MSNRIFSSQLIEKVKLLLGLATINANQMIDYRNLNYLSNSIVTPGRYNNSSLILDFDVCVDDCDNFT